MNRPTPTLIAAAALAASSLAQAEEGMWTLDNLPRAQMQARYGFTPDAAWTDKLMRASARLAGGCSASFISPQGLVMTNHHCVAGCLGQLSSPARNLAADGFLAGKREDELRCPGMELNRLESITDVTDAVRAATAGKQGAAFQSALDAARARLSAACRGSAAETVRCDFVDLYRGGQYQIYKYHRYSDVRLVWAPEEAIAAFGGDPDNYMFPRYDLDVSFLRAYEGGKPATSSAHFRFKPAGAEAGELVFSVGTPGQTQRLLTVAQLETTRDGLALYAVPGLSEMRGFMLQYARGDAEAKRLATGSLEGIENGLKVVQGQLRTLMDPELLNRKREQEQALRAFVAADPALKARVGEPWRDIAQAQLARRALGTEHALIEEGHAFGSGYYQMARTLVRGAAERAKPDGERLREFNEAALPQIEQRLRSRAPLYPAFEQARLALSLTRLRSLLGVDAPIVKQVLGTRSPEQLAQMLVSQTRLADPAERQRLWAGGQAAIAASDDPFIVLARSIEPAARALRARFEAEVSSVENEAGQRVALASFARTGKGSYPDATFSLRVSYGEVRGWEENGQTIAPFTDYAGLYARATGSEPFELPPSWIAAKPRLDPQQRFNFAATLDTVGGSSGSPVLNRQGEVVGVLFDGNQHSLGDAFYYDARLNRSVVLHAGAIVDALRQVYRADALLAEVLAVP